MRHRPGLWNGIWSDMFIESTFMRYGHHSETTGITLKPPTMKIWALGLHVCSQLMKDVSEIKENDGETSVAVHKEEMPARKQADAVDREKLRKKLTTCIDPLQTEKHPNGLVNIVTGRLSPLWSMLIPQSAQESSRRSSMKHSGPRVSTNHFLKKLW